MSLFNAWVAFGSGQFEDSWHEVILSTARGTVDPRTAIPPALATLKCDIIIQTGTCFFIYC